MPDDGVPSGEFAFVPRQSDLIAGAPSSEAAVRIVLLLNNRF